MSLDQNMLGRRIATFCAQEVERQRDTPIAVGWMVNAYYTALEWRSLSPFFSLDQIETLGKLVLPHKCGGFRSTMVHIGGKLCPPPQVAKRILENLEANQGNVSPDVGYYEFEVAHPFVDGNGRVGAILYNWMNKTLWNPVTPPDMWK